MYDSPSTCTRARDLWRQNSSGGTWPSTPSTAYGLPVNDGNLLKMKQSSLFRWFGSEKDLPTPKTPRLPDPNAQENDVDKRSVFAANVAVDDVVLSGAAAPRKRRGAYHVYDGQTRAKIAKSAEEHGLSKASRLLSKELGHSLTTSTVQSIRNEYRRRLKEDAGDPESIDVLPTLHRGRPLLLGGDIDEKVLKYVKALRDAGAVVNRKIVAAAALGIVQFTRPSLLSENGGTLDLSAKNGRSWCESFLRRANFVERKGTKAAKKLPEDFPQQKAAFLKQISDVIKKHAIPDDLIINLDETPLRIVPVAKRTLEQVGAKQVPIVGKEDKREITALLACTFSACLLPPQLLYEGKTERCHPKGVKFPAGWDIYHTESHWSNQHTIQRFIKEVLQPWVVQHKKRLNLGEDQKSLVLMDVFKAHRTPNVAEVLQENNFITLFVPANCTSELQPLDVRGNAALKSDLKDAFTTWYAEKVRNALAENLNDYKAAVKSVQPDLRLSVMKPIHAGWTITAFSALEERRDLIRSAWRYTGIAGAVADARNGSTEQQQPDGKAQEPASASCCSSQSHTAVPDATQSQLGDQAQSEDSASATVASKLTHQEQISGKLACVETTSFMECFMEESQSSLSGERGSSACTLIALLVCQRLLREVWKIPPPGEVPGAEAQRVLVSCMVEGNALYDRARVEGLLSLQQALDIAVDIPVRMSKEIFLTAETGWQGTVRELLTMAKSSQSGTAAAIVISTPYSFVISASSIGAVLVVDSHSHGLRKGALLAISKRGSSVPSIARYVQGFLSRQFACSQQIRLKNGTHVPREYHAGILQLK